MTRQILQSEFELKKEKMQDPLFVKNLRQEIIGEVYESISGSLTVRNQVGGDAIVSLVDGYVEAQLGHEE